jgi:ABC-type cobalt transport system substrate-binding protein
MTRRKKVMIVLAIMLVIAGAVLLFTREEEPTYQGKRLSEWTLACNEDGTDDHTAQAILAIGTNAIPWFVKWIQCEQPNAPDWLFDLAPKRMVEVIIKPMRRAIGAREGLWILGTNAAVATPALTHLMNLTNREWTSRNATMALAGIGKESLPPLMKRLEQPAPGDEVFFAVGNMGYLGTNMYPVVQLVATHAIHRSIHTEAAVRCLGRLHLQPESVLPVLINCLDKTNAQNVRLAALSALGRFGTNALQAIPVIHDAENDGNMQIRSKATNIFSKILPDPGADASHQ